MPSTAHNVAALPGDLNARTETLTDDCIEADMFRDIIDLNDKFGLTKEFHTNKNGTALLELCKMMDIIS